MFLKKNDRAFEAREWKEVSDTLRAHTEDGKSPQDLANIELARKIENEIIHAGSWENPTTLVLTQEQADRVDFYAERIGLEKGKICRD